MFVKMMTLSDAMYRQAISRPSEENKDNISESLPQFRIKRKERLNIENVNLDQNFRKW